MRVEKIQRCAHYLCYTVNNVNNVVYYFISSGTHEVGGLTVIQALEIIRGCRGMNIIGGDLVEVGTRIRLT